MVASYSTTFIPSFVNIDQMVQNLKRVTHARHSILKSTLPSYYKVPYRTDLISLNGKEMKHLGYYKGREWSFKICFAPSGISLKLVLVIVLQILILA